ncbi:hypothetical protein COW95_03720, partial [Candidatus Peregrinibacteria bacterium CG22_combo_CG10-13_8_21_14_all_49_11]
KWCISKFSGGIFTDVSFLPSFNSTVIELYMDRIPGLSEWFLALNDDFFFGAPVEPSDFFTEDGCVRVHLTDEPCPSGEPLETDPAWVAGLKNANVLLNQRFGKEQRFIGTHNVRPMRRSICEACRQDFAEAYQEATAHRFRSHSDIMLPLFLHVHYALSAGEGELATMDEYFANGIGPDLGRNEQHFAEIRRRRPVLFCLNDQGMYKEPEASVQLQTFLEECFPHTSPFERVCFVDCLRRKICHPFSRMVNCPENTSRKESIPLRGLRSGSGESASS